MAKKGKALLVVGLAALVIGAGAVGYAGQALRPMPTGPSKYVRFETAASHALIFHDLEQQGIVRDGRAARVYARLKGAPQPIAPGTYRVAPGMTVDQIIVALKKPVQRMVRIPEGHWISRVAERLENEGVCGAAEYIALANQPELFEGMVDFPLPKDSLEGYLYPDTYDLPPLIGAKDVVARQLKAFERKAWPLLKEAKDPHRVLTIASMVELEAALDKERPIIAGVIENRIKKGMTLDIDATVLYAEGKWRVLGPGQVRKVKSPYNTYLNRGLPPGPIGSPSEASITGAMNPASHPWLFYVARPDRSHTFTSTYAEHKAAIVRNRAEFKKQEAE